MKQNFTTVVQAASDLLVAQDDLELGGLPTSAYLYLDCDNLPQSPIPKVFKSVLLFLLSQILRISKVETAYIQ